MHSALQIHFLPVALQYQQIGMSQAVLMLESHRLSLAHLTLFHVQLLSAIWSAKGGAGKSMGPCQQPKSRCSYAKAHCNLCHCYGRGMKSLSDMLP